MFDRLDFKIAAASGRLSRGFVLHADESVDVLKFKRKARDYYFCAAAIHLHFIRFFISRVIFCCISSMIVFGISNGTKDKIYRRDNRRTKMFNCVKSKVLSWK